LEVFSVCAHVYSESERPDANPYYEVTWALYPNLAMDLLVPQMARLISVGKCHPAIFTLRINSTQTRNKSLKEIYYPIVNVVGLA
jgi:hypothetical protein